MNSIRLTQSDGTPGPEVVVGLEWDTVSKADWKKQKKTSKEKTIAFAEVPVTSGDTNTINVGTISNDALSSEASTNISLAAWMAHAFRTGTIVAVEQVSKGRENLYWLCIVNNGQVVSGTDIVGEWDEVDETATDLIDVLASQTDIGYLGANASNLTANNNADTTDTPLIAGLPKSAKKKGTLKHPGTINKMAMLAVAGVVGVGAIGVLGWVGYSLLASSETEEDLRKKRMMQIQEAKAEYRNLRTSTAAKQNAGGALQVFLETKLSNTQTVLGGWELTEGQCERQYCSLTYVNNDLTDPSVLQNGTNQLCETLTITPEGVEATCGFSALKHMQQDGTPELDLMTEREATMLRSKLMEAARHIDGVSYGISEASPVQFSGKRYLSNVQLFEEGSWSLMVPASKLPYAIDVIDQFKPTSVTTLNMNWQNKAIEISGSYYKEGES